MLLRRREWESGCLGDPLRDRDRDLDRDLPDLGGDRGAEPRERGSGTGEAYLPTGVLLDTGERPWGDGTRGTPPLRRFALSCALEGAGGGRLRLRSTLL